MIPFTGALVGKRETLPLAGGTLFSVGVAFFAGEALTFAFLAGELIWLSYSIRRALLRDGVRDSGCGLKAFRREAYLELPWFDHIHRFMPAMMLREGWRVETVPSPTAKGRAGRRNTECSRARWWGSRTSSAQPG